MMGIWYKDEISVWKLLSIKNQKGNKNRVSLYLTLQPDSSVHFGLWKDWWSVWLTTETYSSSFLLLTWRTPYESLTMFPPMERSHIHKGQARLYPIPLLSHRIQCPCPNLDSLSVKSCCSLENAVLWHRRDHIRVIHLLPFLLKLQAHKRHISKEKNGPDHSRLPIELTKLKNTELIAFVI